VQIGATDLCKDNVEQEIKIEFFQSSTSGKHKFLCMNELITLGQLKEGTAQYTAGKKAQITLQNLKVERTHSFLEYVFGGCEIDLTMAIDFTLSNGDPRSRDSLHFFDPNKNQYLQAINSVGSILQFYNTDK